MKVIKPTTITTAMLVSTTATNSVTAWNPVTAYVLNDIAYLASTHRKYQRLVAGTTATSPELDSVNWLDIGPTNDWAMFDSEVSTQTSEASPLTVVVKPGLANSLAFFGLEGTELEITVRDALAGAIVYTTTVSLEGSIVTDWYEYFFEPFDQLSEVVLTDLPPYGDAHITASVTGGGTVKCGVLAVGSVYELGDTLAGASSSINDYSRKETDEFGTTTFVRRAYSKRMTVRIVVPNTRLNRTQQTLADLRATPCVWVGSNADGYEVLSVFGFYKSFSIDIAYATTSFCSLEIEGLT